MRRLLLPFILFLLVVLEGVSLELLPFVNSSTLIIPHWVLLFLVLITLFYDQIDTHVAVFYGIIFGLLIDVVYIDVLGVYMFVYATVIYIIHKLKGLVHMNFYVTMILGMLSIILADSIIYILFLVIGLTNMFWNDYLFYRLMPTLLANLIFFILFYPFSKRVLSALGKDMLTKNEFV